MYRNYQDFFSLNIHFYRYMINLHMQSSDTTYCFILKRNSIRFRSKTLPKTDLKENTYISRHFKDEERENLKLDCRSKCFKSSSDFSPTPPSEAPPQGQTVPSSVCLADQVRDNGWFMLPAIRSGEAHLFDLLRGVIVGFVYICRSVCEL